MPGQQEWYNVILTPSLLTSMMSSQVQYSIYPFKDEAQTALFKDPVRTAL